MNKANCWLNGYISYEYTYENTENTNVNLLCIAISEAYAKTIHKTFLIMLSLFHISLYHRGQEFCASLGRKLLKKLLQKSQLDEPPGWVYLLFSIVYYPQANGERRSRR